VTPPTPPTSEQKRPKQLAAGREQEKFEDKGTTKREREVARLLKNRIPGVTVSAVRFSSSPAGGLKTFVVLPGGDALDGGIVDDAMTAQQQADAIIKNMKEMMK